MKSVQNVNIRNIRHLERCSKSQEIFSHQKEQDFEAISSSTAESNFPFYRNCSSQKPRNGSELGFVNNAVKILHCTTNTRVCLDNFSFSNKKKKKKFDKNEKYTKTSVV